MIVSDRLPWPSKFARSHRPTGGIVAPAREHRVTEQPGWESPSRPPGEQPELPRPPLSTDWAAEQPPPQSWSGQPGYGPQPGVGPQPGWGQRPAWGQQPSWLPPKPGVIPLRPLGVGEILDGAVSTIRAKPRLMLGLSTVVAVLTQLVTVPVSWVLLHDSGDKAFTIDTSASSSTNDNFAFEASSLTATAIQILVTLVATLLLTGILTVVLSRAVLGQDIDGRAAWGETRPRLPALVGVLLLVFLIEIGLAALLLGPGIALAASGSGVAAALALVAGIPLFFCASVYLYIAFALAPAVTVLEKQPVLASLARSRRLIKGAWWRTFGMVLLVNIIAGIVNGIFSSIFTVAAFIAAGAASNFQSFNPYELVPLIVTAVGTIIGAAITWPFTAVATALIYVDRRIRREGLDLELARAAGLVPATSAATPGAPLDDPASGGGPYSGGPYTGGPDSADQPPPPYGG
jgi:hypothetical protein